ncbi:MAG: leucyl aminopeptidase family protein [Actinomycetales bacterium]
MEFGTAPAPWLALAVRPHGRAVDAVGDTAAVLSALGLDLAQIAADAAFTGSAGSTLAFPVARRLSDASGDTGSTDSKATDSESADPWLGAVRRIVLVGVGDAGVTALRRAGAGLARACQGGEVVGTRLFAGQGPAPELDQRARAERLSAFVEGFLLGAFQPIASGTRERPVPIQRLRLARIDGAGIDGAGQQWAGDAVRRARSVAAAAWLARDLAGYPSSVKNPRWLADSAAELAGHAGLSVEVKDEQQLAEEGFGALLAVGQGSATPPRLVVLGYTPQTSSRRPSRRPRHIVLVGKGITFDTGGLSLKPADAMIPMRTDMTGAAVVLAAILAAARNGSPHRITAVLALAENAIGARSYRPGDVVTCWDGRTVEIANTDAEGRMVLADALSWSAATLAPDAIVDVATLTGAATLGLGRRHAALYSTDDSLADELLASGDRRGETLWRMPLVQDYAPAIESTVADLAHIPMQGGFGGGGSITAALFLREFATRVPPQPRGGLRRRPPADTPAAPAWAHLDIAGPARFDADSFELCKGPTGFGARLLADWLSPDAD